jgi:hypothetical protein
MTAIEVEAEAHLLAACIVGFFLMAATVMIIGWLKRRGLEGARTVGMVVKAALVLVALNLATPWALGRLAEAILRGNYGQRGAIHLQNGPHVAPVLGVALVAGLLHFLQKVEPTEPPEPPDPRPGRTGNTKRYD